MCHTRSAPAGLLTVPVKAARRANLAKLLGTEKAALVWGRIIYLD